MKKICMIILFIFGLNIIVSNISYTLLPKYNGYNGIDYFKQNHQLDIIWLGPSTTFFSISPMYIWNKYKVTSFNNAHNGQSLSTYYMLKETAQYKPKCVFFDITVITNNSFTNYNSKEKMYIWFLNILHRIQYLKYVNEEYVDVLYVFLLNVFHNRWKEIKEYDFINNKNLYYFLGSGLANHHAFYIREQKEPKPVTGKFNFNDKSIEIIHEMAQYIKENNLNVIFWCPPTTMQQRYELSFLFDDIIKPYNIPYINFNNKNLKDINFDYNNDFYDDSHLNIYGSEKVSDYLVKYAKINYNIENHENDPKYASWDKNYIKYKREVNKLYSRTRKIFTEWQKYIYYDNYTIFISSNGDNVLNRLPQDMKDKFATLGLNKFETDKKNQKYAAIIDDGKVFFEEISDKKVEYKGRMNNKVNLLVSSENKKATINVSGKPKAKNRYGINFVIYDKVNREIIDSIWLDPSNFNEVRR